MDHVPRHTVVADLLLTYCVEDLTLESICVSKLVIGKCLVELDKLVDKDAEDVVVYQL